MQPVIASKLSVSTLRCALVLAQLLSMGALSAACSSATPGETPGSVGEEAASTKTSAIAGTDGNATVNAAGTVVNRYTALAANAAVGATSIQVASVAALAVGADALAVGDLILVVQMQGATINTAAVDKSWGTITSLNAAGQYEMVEVLGVSANVIQLSCALKNAYTTAGATQIVRVPQYDTLTVAGGASIVAPAWNGTTGGIVAIHARNNITLVGDIDVSALGFRGGNDPTDDTSQASTNDVAIFSSAAPADGGRKGEGIAGASTLYGRGPNANGGGGGNSHNAGGGGGANGKAGGAWTGQGLFNLTVTGGATSWLLDPNFSATASEGGGRGGYSYSSANLNALTTAPGNAGWGGNNRRERGGLGGHALDNDVASRVFMGGGGGQGDANNGHAGRGGNGGGIVILSAAQVNGAGRILANGEAGVSSNSTAGGSTSGDAPGGGGAGGSVIVRATTAAGFSVQARGGAGGNQLVNNGNEAEGPGGGGGGGFVSISTTVTADVSGGVGGTTTSPALTEFPANGATYGNSGLAQLGAGATGSIPYCVDASAPDTRITVGPTGSIASTSTSFSFDSPGDTSATFECSLDAAPFAACTSPRSLTGLAQGSHDFAVRAKDTIGNIDGSPATRTFIVDTAAPTVSLDSGPSGTVADDDATFTFSTEAGATLECKLDAGAFAVCTSPRTLTALTDGPHTFEVRARDAADNVSASVSRTWTVDTAAPVATIDSGPSGPVAVTTAAFTFSTEAGATLECKLDNAATFTTCTSPLNLSALAEGAHSFQVRARDAAGNVGTPSTRNWAVDTTAPTVSIDSGPTGTVSNTSADFTFSTEVGASLECKLDAAAFTSCSSPLAITGPLTEGAHTFQVRARDALDNLSAPVTRNWTVDLTGPNVSIDQGPTGTVRTRDVRFVFSSLDAGASFECSVDLTPAVFTPCTSALDLSALIDGAHNFQVRAKDAVGNFSAPATRTFSVDATPPETQILTSPVSPTEATSGIFTFNSPTDATGVTFLCRIGSEAFAACSSGVSKTLVLGTQTFLVKAVDAAGNEDLTPASVDITVVGADPDQDGISTEDEEDLGTDPDDADSDDDGVLDGSEPDRDKDTDGDGLINALDPDSDDDGLFDGTELGKDCLNAQTDPARGACRPDADNGLTKTDPLAADTDGGDVSDGSEDANLNGAVDAGETDPTSGNGADDAQVVDTDADGLSDELEETLRSNPQDKDSDDDGVPDGEEPNPSDDGDRDGLVDVLDPDSDNDGLFDGTELGRDCAGENVDLAAKHCRADADPTTTTSAVDPDTDDGGVTDGNEDSNLDGKLDSATETNPVAGQGADDGRMQDRDTDGDGLTDQTETEIGSDPEDADSDDDGLLDGLEPNPSDDHDGDNVINVLDADSDGDGLFDGTEAGKDCNSGDTDTTKNLCVADADSSTVTWVLNADTDFGSVSDGEEDANHNGFVDVGETDPLVTSDDRRSTGEGGAGGGGGSDAGGSDAGGSAGAPSPQGGAPAEGGAAGASSATGGSDASGGTSATGGVSNGGSPAAGGTLATGGTSSGGAAAGGPTDRNVVVLGGGLCSFRPSHADGVWALLIASCLGAVVRRRRAARREHES